MGTGERLNLFEHALKERLKKEAPLAARMRPESFSEFVGQEHLLAPGKALRQAVDADKIPSIILWGPPGSGKTTLAFLIAHVTHSHFSAISAVSAGVGEMREIIHQAEERLSTQGQRTIIFIDEIHRFNKAQQDAILPYVENGTITLIGATTENPSFEVISPLLSRCRVFSLRGLTDDELKVIVQRALEDKEKGLGNLNLTVDTDALDSLILLSQGDARVALNALEMSSLSLKEGEKVITLPVIEGVFQQRALTYDKQGEEHYNIISALHKSLRDSDPDAGLYWLGRMLEAGEDPLYVARRLVRFASEDVGMADPQALVVAMAAQQAVHFIGMPEGELALAQAVVYLATAPKSNSIYDAYGKVKEDIKRTRNEPVPLHLRNPVTSLMKEAGYGKGYKYAHDYAGHFVRQKHLPDSLRGRRYYRPGSLGFEAVVEKRLKELQRLAGDEKKENEEK